MSWYRDIAIRILFTPIILGAARASAKDIVSGDAYARFDEQSQVWTIGTAQVEETLQLTNGSFTVIGFQNKLNHRQYVSGGKGSEEFGIGVNGEMYSGAGGRWQRTGGGARVLGQGEIQLVIQLENDRLRVEKTYLVYPGTGIIRQWVSYQNRTPGTITVSNPYFLVHRLRPEEAEKLILNYMTGGGFVTGSQILKEVRLSNTYGRTFDSKSKILSRYYAPYLDMSDTADDIETGLGLDGIKQDHGYPLPYASGVYMPWFCIRDPQAEDGMFVGFDYWGRWQAEIGNYYGGPGYIGLKVSGYKKELAPGESVLTPVAFTGVFVGDLDSMGNQLKAWQYRYLWDFTSEKYFGGIRFATEMRWGKGDVDGPYWGGTQENWDYRLAEMLRTAGVMRYVGAGILWQDAGWSNRSGDNDDPGFAEVNQYLKKSGMGLAVWWPYYLISNQTRAVREHPNWTTYAEAPIPVLDTSQKDVVEYLRTELDQKVAKWGDFQWKLDGSPVWPVNKDETPMLAQYHNVTELLQGFRRRHPGFSIYICSTGGNLVGFESLRLSDVSQLTDGGTLFISNYYSSYLFPPDKIDDWTRVSNFTWEHARQLLTMAPAWAGDRGLGGHQPGLLLNNGLENQRRNFEIYRYLLHQGVAGRWSLVYHPKVEGDDPVYYFQRSSRDGKRGVIILKRFIQGEVRVFPKGLDQRAIYDLRFEMSKRTASTTGADLMMNGILLVNPAPGELVYLGLPNFPGSGGDHTVPSDPGSVRKKFGTNIGITGVELEWAASKDNNWLSYYQVYRDGAVIDKVAKGTYYFDHSGGPENLSARYEIQAIDGDGNASRKVEATAVSGGSVTYTARGGFLSGKDYSYQGANGWSYEEWDGDSRGEMLWDGALGHMGLYKGTRGTGHQKSVIGASWMRPGHSADAVRVFTLPHSGEVTITGTVYKDIYHTYGDGVRVKLVKNNEKLWPEKDWEAIAATDTRGKGLIVKVVVEKGDKLYFIVNRNGDTVDDETVWDPQIAYDRTEVSLERPRRLVVDDQSTLVRYAGPGWQELGMGIGINGNDRDQGFLAGRTKGTLSVSGTAGDKMILKFRGTGVELLGDTGRDRGVASIVLDGQTKGTIDTFSPERTADPGPEVSVREVSRWPEIPPIRIWGIRGLENSDHTLELIVTGKKNQESVGTFIGIDALTVFNGSPVQ